MVFFSDAKNNLFKERPEEFPLVNLNFAIIFQRPESELIMKENKIFIHVESGNVFLTAKNLKKVFILLSRPRRTS